MEHSNSEESVEEWLRTIMFIRRNNEEWGKHYVDEKDIGTYDASHGERNYPIIDEFLNIDGDKNSLKIVQFRHNYFKKSYELFSEQIEIYISRRRG